MLPAGTISGGWRYERSMRERFRRRSVNKNFTSHVPPEGRAFKVQLNTLRVRGHFGQKFRTNSRWFQPSTGNWIRSHGRRIIKNFHDECVQQWVKVPTDVLVVVKANFQLSVLRLRADQVHRDGMVESTDSTETARVSRATVVSSNERPLMYWHVSNKFSHCFDSIN